MTTNIVDDGIINTHKVIDDIVNADKVGNDINTNKADDKIKNKK